MLKTDMGIIKVPIILLPQASLYQAIKKPKALIRKLFLQKQHFDLIIASRGVPWWIGRYLANRMDASLLLRLWDFKASKFGIYLKNKDYKGMFLLVPSLIHNFYQIICSRAIVCLDYNIWTFIRKMPFLRDEKIFIVYPTFITLKKQERIDLDAIFETVRGVRNYVFSITNVNTKNAPYVEKKLFNILIGVARKNPTLNVLVIGSNLMDVKMAYPSPPVVPRNMILMGKIYSDVILEYLYKNAELVIVPVLYGAISNRLLESLYYGKAVLTNDFTRLLHPELKKLESVAISDYYAKYGEIVSKLLEKGRTSKLELRARDAYKNLFSTKQCGLAMGKIITRACATKGDWIY